MNSPLITVIMPMYNSEKHISEAVNSILNQTFTDFELLIIDDASTDSSVSIIQSYNDPRIKLTVKPKNSGYTSSLNMGLAMARGKYIARMDSDDISILDRFEKQVAFMEQNKNIAVCGSWFKCIGTNEVIQHPATHDAIKVAMLSYCAIGHPTVVIRNNFLQEHELNYNIAMEPAEDYDLWTRICSIGKLANIPEVLLYYRLHDGQVSSLRADRQQLISEQIQINLLKQLNSSLTVSMFSINYNLLFPTLHKQLLALNELVVLNNTNLFFEKKLFTEFIRNRQQKLTEFFLVQPSSVNFKVLYTVICNYKLFFKNVSLKSIIKYLVKVLIGYSPQNKMHK